MNLVIVAHNLRSAHNIGSLLRTADGLGVDLVILSGYTPYPVLSADDPRLPHEQRKITKLIDKTALGAATSQAWRRQTAITETIAALKADGYYVAALEQTPMSIPLPKFIPPAKIALVLGREVEGIEPEVIALCDQALEIPMYGKKESFNVVQAAAMAMYHCRWP